MPAFAIDLRICIRYGKESRVMHTSATRFFVFSCSCTLFGNFPWVETMDPLACRRPATPPSYSELERLDDEELMVSLKAGCNDALAVLFDRYHRLVLSIAFKIVRDSGEAEDVMQNVFLEIFRTVAQFDPSKGSTKVWILQHAYHRAINRRQYLNARRYYNHTEIEDAEAALSRDTLFGGYTQNELKYLLEKALGTLNGQQKQVIELASYKGMSMQEIADKTGESVSNVRHHYYRGLTKLRRLITGSRALKKAAGND